MDPSNEGVIHPVGKTRLSCRGGTIVAERKSAELKGDLSMKTKAAAIWGPHEKWQVEEVELDPPRAEEVLIKLTATGLCHSDYHLVTGDIPLPYPAVGGA